MKEFIIVGIIALIVTPFVGKFMDTFGITKPEPVEVESKLPFDQKVVVIAKQGIIGCQTKEQFQSIAKSSERKDAAAMKEMMDYGLCFYIKNGSELMMQKGSCVEQNSASEIFPFVVTLSKQKLYLPCFAVK